MIHAKCGRTDKPGDDEGVMDYAAQSVSVRHLILTSVGPVLAMAWRERPMIIDSGGFPWYRGLDVSVLSVGAC